MRRPWPSRSSSSTRSTTPRYAERSDYLRWDDAFMSHARATADWPSPLRVRMDGVGEDQPDAGLAERVYRMRARIASAIEAWRRLGAAARDEIAAQIAGGHATIARWIQRAEVLLRRTAWAAGAGVATGTGTVVVLVALGLYLYTRRRS